MSSTEVQSGVASGEAETSSRSGRGARTFRIAALGDIHYNGSDRSILAQIEADVAEQCDVLALCGDLTTHGEPKQIRGVAEGLARLNVPVVTVLGNHDHETGNADEVTRILRDNGVHVLDGDTVEIEGIGFAGVKGFCGGFDRGALAAFGEPLIKQFVQEALDEALKLENALRQLSTDVKVALLHYAPISATVQGEPEVIYPFLGSSRLLQAIDTLQPDVVFHGHAHHGTFEGRTPAGVPVFNVSLPVLAERDESFHVWHTPAPDRRGDGARASEELTR